MLDVCHVNGKKKKEHVFFSFKMTKIIAQSAVCFFCFCQAMPEHNIWVEDIERPSVWLQTKITLNILTLVMGNLHVCVISSRIVIHIYY